MASELDKKDGQKGSGDGRGESVTGLATNLSFSLFVVVVNKKSLKTTEHLCVCEKYSFYALILECG